MNDQSFRITHKPTQLKLVVLKQHLQHRSDDETLRHIIELAFKKYFPNGIKQ
jgi:hypothetical protein